MKYRNKRWGFELDFPAGWGEPSLLKRWFSSRYAAQGSQPEFYGPAGAGLKIAVGPISPVPSVEKQQRKLEQIAAKYGHGVIETGEIEVAGKLHATMTSEVPGAGVLKNYSLIFGGTEYLVTAQGDWNECDSIVQSFRVA